MIHCTEITGNDTITQSTASSVTHSSHRPLHLVSPIIVPGDGVIGAEELELLAKSKRQLEYGKGGQEGSVQYMHCILYICWMDHMKHVALHMHAMHACITYMLT